MKRFKSIITTILAGALAASCNSQNSTLAVQRPTEAGALPTSTETKASPTETVPTATPTPERPSAEGWVAFSTRIIFG